MKFKNNFKGYTLIEAMIALTVLSASIVISLNIIVSSADSENLNRDLLIGNQLSEEGIQTIINLYQTNLLKFGKENITKCALMLPSYTGNADSCLTSPLKLELGNYFTGIDLASNKVNWSYTRTNEDLKSGKTLNDLFRLHITNTPESISIYGLKNSDSEPSEFYRMITIKEFTTEHVSFSSNVSWVRNGGYITSRENSYIINFNNE